MVGESLSLRLLGSPLVTVGGEALPRLRSRKSLHLLALLALKAGAAIERDFLIGTLWPESNQSAGQESLKKTLADLRTALGSEAERICTPGRGQLRLDLSGEAFCDVLTFDRAMARFAKTGDPSVAEEAVTLYRGPLLEGTDEDWIQGERALRERAAQEALLVLGRRARDQKETAKALTLLRRAEQLDPLDESIQRELIQTLAASGDINAARRAFRELRLRLHEALRQEPSAETRALMQRLTEVPAPNTEAMGGAESFPRFATPLIGRDTEKAAILERLARGPLTTLVGIGGMGKTRLATALAKTRPRALFIDLAPLPANSDADAVARTIAQALGQSGITRLRNLLACDEALLVVDNCEHVIEGVRTALQLYLPEDATVRILATSREPLGLRGEQVVYLETLPIELAAELFRARAQDAGATLTESEEVAIARICARLDGLPLAIELAAARCGALSPEELLRRLDEPLRILSTRQPDLPERQRTMRATLDGSWATLTQEEQDACAALSVFVAPFTIEDAAAVVTSEDALDTVLTLHAHSLLSARPGGWTFLQPVRVYAAEKLAERPGYETAIHRRHAEHLAALSERETARRYSDGREQAFRRLVTTRLDREAALAWAATHDTSLFLQLALPQITLLRELRLTDDAMALIRAARNRVTDKNRQVALKTEEALSSPHGQRSLLKEALELAENPAQRASILYETACLANSGRESDTLALFEQAMAECLSAGNFYLAGLTATHLNAQVPPGASEERLRLEPLFHQALALAEEARLAARQGGNREAEATALRAQGHLQRSLGQKEDSVLPFQRIAELWRAAGNVERSADALRSLGHQWACVQRRAECIKAYDEGIALYDTFADTEERVLSRCRAAYVASNPGWFGAMRRWLDSCLPLLPSCSPAAQAPTYYYLSMAYYYSGSGECSVEYIRRCRSLRFQMGDEKDRQIAERMLALALIEQGQLAEASALLEGLYTLHASLDQPILLCSVLTHQARIARELGELDQAKALLEKADGFCPEPGSYYWDRRRMEGANIYRAMGDYAAAQQQLEEYWLTPSAWPYANLFAKLIQTQLDLDRGMAEKTISNLLAIREETLIDENLRIAAEAEDGLAEAARQLQRDTDFAQHMQRATQLWELLERPRPPTFK